MKKKKRETRLLTFTILPNDANQGVKRFRIHRGIIYILFALPVIPIMALIYYLTANLEQQAQIEELSKTLEFETAKSEQLAATVAVLEEETEEAKARLRELSELEVQMRNYINQLPTMVEPSGSGGLYIVADEKSMENSEGELFLAPTTELAERYKDTLALVDELSEELQYTPTAWPTIPNTITSDYGVREDPIRGTTSFHSGVDIRGYYGTPVFATADGVISMAKYYGSYGNAIKIKHSNTYETLYSHLMSMEVKAGDIVKKGDQIGTIGSTGRATGPHLHYEVIIEGEPVDPKTYFNIYGEFDIE